MFINLVLSNFKQMILLFEQFLEMAFQSCLSSDTCDERHSSQGKVAFPSRLPLINIRYSRCQLQKCTINLVTILRYNTNYRAFHKKYNIIIYNLHQQPNSLTFKKYEPQSSGAQYHLFRLHNPNAPNNKVCIQRKFRNSLGNEKLESLLGSSRLILSAK